MRRTASRHERCPVDPSAIAGGGRGTPTTEDEPMSIPENADDSTHSPEPTFGRYGSLADGDELLVYDRENDDSWIQSDAAVRLEEMN
jgi:hypothetical protein